MEGLPGKGSSWVKRDSQREMLLCLDRAVTSRDVSKSGSSFCDQEERELRTQPPTQDSGAEGWRPESPRRVSNSLVPEQVYLVPSCAERRAAPCTHSAP